MSALEIGSDNSYLSTAVHPDLVVLSETVEDLAARAIAPATVRAYGSDWACFSGWCERVGLGSMPAAPETVALYLAHLAGHRSHATLRRRIATISQAHKRAGFDSPTRAALVELVWRGICRKYGSEAKHTVPTRTEEVRRMVAGLDPERLIGVRDRALLVLGLAGALRRSELVALDVPDVTEVPDGLKVRLRWSKTGQEGQGVTIGLPWGSEAMTCPVRSYRAWLEASGIPVGPLFRPVTKGGALGLRRLSASAVAAVVKRSAGRVGLDPENLAAHSLRAGMITSAAEVGVHERDIMRHSRHKSIPVMRRYIEDATLFQDNAAARIGL